MSPSMLKVNSNLLNLLCFIYFCFLVYMPKVTAGSLVWGLGVTCCLPAFMPAHPLKIRPLKFLQSRKKRKKMTSMESKLYQLSVNRHTLEDFRFSCWGIFSQSEYTTPWGKESFLSCWTGLAKIDMCNWLWSQLISYSPRATSQIGRKNQPQRPHHMRRATEQPVDIVSSVCSPIPYYYLSGAFYKPANLWLCLEANLKEMSVCNALGSELGQIYEVDGGLDLMF